MSIWSYNETEITENFVVNKLQALYLNIEGQISLEEICEKLNISVDTLFFF